MQRLGSSRMLSIAPSSMSHCLRISVWIIGHISAWTRVEALVGPVAVKEWPLHEVGLLNADAADPATIPSKSSGKSCTGFKPCLPPVEQPE